MDVTTLEPMAEELRQRFGLHDAVLVADRGMFSADNVVALAESGQRYILALRSRQQTEGELALDLGSAGWPAQAAGREGGVAVAGGGDHSWPPPPGRLLSLQGQP